MIFKISGECGGPERVGLFLYVAWGCNVVKAYVMNNWWFSSQHWYMPNGWQTSLHIFFPCFPSFIPCCVLALCCCDLVWRSLSRSLLLSCFNMKRQTQSLGLLSPAQKWETLIVHYSFQWNVRLFILPKRCSPTQSLKTDNYPRTWNRINMHWSMSWTFPSANNKGNCCQSTKQGERLAVFLRQLRLATVYSLSP